MREDHIYPVFLLDNHDSCYSTRSSDLTLTRPHTSVYFFL